MWEIMEVLLRAACIKEVHREQDADEHILHFLLCGLSAARTESQSTGN